MPERPLLIFPLPTRVGRYKLGGGQPKALIRPELRSQVRRLEPVLTALERSIEEQRTILRSDVTGVEPEMVLVFETRGLITDFFKAVKAIPELDWLGEKEEDFTADQLFYYQDAPEKDIRGKIYFVMTNYDALQKILRLWSNYKYGRVYERGTTKWRDLFQLLHDVRAWGVMDRIQETGLLEDLAFRQQYEQQLVPFEIELWFRKTAAERQQAVNRIQSLLDQFTGEIISTSIIPEVAYHGLLVKAPIQLFNNLTEQTDIDFFKSADIMYLRPVGQCSIKLTDDQEASPLNKQIPAVEQLSDPIAALLDGMPMQNHVLLADRLNIDDPDNFSEGYLAANRMHGTGMASMIIYGDLQENNTPIKSRLYVRPIMKVEQGFRGPVELIPENVLTVDLIHRAVRRLFESDGGLPPVAPGIKIINLSVGDPFRIFDGVMSSWAKLLDWLSFKYKVLFIVSAGNCSDDLDYQGLQIPFATMLQNKQQLLEHSIRAMYANSRNRKIISPAESINAITAGSSDHDLSPNAPANGLTMLFESPNFLSPLSRMGLGYKRSIKPDVIAPGGKAIFRQDVGGAPLLKWVNITREPGIQVAAPSANSLNSTIFSSGTSNSAAHLTHIATKLYENLLESGFAEPITTSLFPLIAKALLVHCASWNETVSQQILSSIAPASGNNRDLVTRFLGYGNVIPDRIFDCTQKRVTIIGFGSLSPDDGHLFELPIPVAISGSTLWRSLTVTLAWLSPVNALNQNYRQAKLWFDFPNKRLDQILNVSRKFYDNDTVNRGTVQHEIFDGIKASAFLDGTKLPIRVNCKEDAPSLPATTKINYVLAVTLEVAPAMQVDVYDALVQLLVKQPVPIRQ